MRSLVGAARDDYFDDIPPPPKRRKAPRARGPKAAKRRAPQSTFAPWVVAMRATGRRAALWSAALLLFLAAVAVAGLVSGGHVSQAFVHAHGAVDAAMVDAGLSVQKLTVQGRGRTERDAIVRMLGLNLGMPMLYVDVEEARARLEALPWVKSAQVRRIWPDHILVEIVERRPVALWQNENELVLIDRGGHAIRTDSRAAALGLPLVVGHGANTAVASLLDLIATQPFFTTRVKVAVRVGGRRWNLRLDNGVEVRLPEEGAQNALAELRRLERKEGIFARRIKAIDLRFADRLVLTLPAT